MSAVIDPLATTPRGVWESDALVVAHTGRAFVAEALTAAPVVTRGRRFTLHRLPERLALTHALRGDDLDDDVVGWLLDELSDVGVDIEAALTGIVLSTLSDPLTAWSVYYANTLAALRSPWRDGVIRDFAPVHDHAASLVTGRTVIDLGSCFGFLPLRLAAAGRTVTATDVCAGTMGLLGRVAARRRTVLRTVVCDAARTPLAGASADTVLAIHLLEHLEPEHGAAVLREMLRLARRRVVVAVPFEDVPESAFGHVRTFDAADLAELGVSTGLDWDVTDHHGGWLVVDL